MDFRDSPEERALRLALRDWLAANTPRPDQAPQRDHPDFIPFLKNWQARLHAAGWLGLSWPVEHGGRGLPMTAEIIFHAELARAQAPPVINIVGINLVGSILMEWGTGAQMTRYLPRILSGGELWCQGFSEPNAGSDLAALSTRAERADGGWTITGQKVWTSFGAVADLCFCLARSDRQSSRHRGISAFIVDMHARGVTVRPIRQITGEGEFTEVFFDRVFVPDEMVVGRPGDGWAVAMAMLAHERRMPNRGTDWQPDAVMRALLAELRAGRVGSLGDDALQRLAHCYVEVQVAKLNRYRNLGRAVTGQFRIEEGSVEKVFFDSTQEHLRHLAVELAGLPGLSTGHWPALYVRALAESVAGGTTEIQKNIIAERLLGLPRESRPWTSP